MEFHPGRILRLTGINKLIGFLTGLLKKLFDPISNRLKDIETNYKDQSTLKKTLICLFQLRGAICFLVLFALVCAAGYFMVKSEGEASAIMSLNYEESAKGLNPNATRFNIYELKSPVVVEKTLNYCGIEATEANIDKVSNSISITPTNSKGFKQDEYYIATSYRISVKKPKELKDISAHDFLAFLSKAYTDTFYSRYTDNRSVLDFDVSEFDDLEYLLVADLLELKANQQSKYLNTRAKQSKSYTDEGTDATFKSLSEQVEDFKTYDVESYRSFVLQTGLAHNKTHFNRVLDYVNLIDTISYNKDMASYEVRYDGIALYNEAMISIVMIPTIDREKNTYYMSKTKTGMDYMASQADAFLQTAQETAKKIKTNTDTIIKMNAGQNLPSDSSKADAMIKDMLVKFDELRKQIETVDKAYIKYKTKDYLTFQIHGMSLMQKLRPKVLGLLAFVILGGAFAVIWIRFRYFGGGDKK